MTVHLSTTYNKLHYDLRQALAGSDDGGARTVVRLRLTLVFVVAAR
jgi:hypothetical protein